MKIIFTFFFSLVLFLGFSQSGLSSKSKKAIKLFKEAQVLPTKQLDPVTHNPDFKSGIEILNKAIAKDPYFWEAYVLLAEYYKNLNQFPSAIKNYENALRIKPEHSRTGLTFYNLGALYLAEGNYEKALKYITGFISHPNANEDYLKDANGIKESAAFAIESMKNPRPFNPENAGPGVNTNFPEYYPTLTVDGKNLMFTRALPFGNNNVQEDFFLSKYMDKVWQKADAMPENVNTDNNEGAPTISADGRKLIFVACADESGSYGENRKGKGSCDLFYTKKIGSKWSNPINLPGNVNSFHWETQPSLSADGKTLYFIRGLRGRGADTKNSDIFVSYLQDDGTWSNAQRLPDVINSPYAEESVHIHPDGKTLYFASRGHVGLGGSDLFVSHLNDNGQWSKPLNLGYPINTKYDENSLIVSAEGDLAFFASDRTGGYGDLDIYTFLLPEVLKPTKTLYFDGKVFDAITKSPLPGHFELQDIETGKQVIISDADAVTGLFTVPLPIDRHYVINVQYPGYAPYSLSFDLTYAKDQTSYHIDVPMNPITSSTENVLQNVYFDLNSARLRKESFVELLNFARFIQENPSLTFELGGHTDTRGNASDNLKLSSERAKAVYDYLVTTAKINPLKLSYKGYGETQPLVLDSEIEKLSTELEKENAHQKNRRTVYKILK
jgi:outer membrane protein OmpA-like peptidoglycan-associated protein/tetratricopeptide (TPR) repeat protein